MIKLYHGTISTCAENIINKGIILSKGNKSVDFGQGFYTTPSKEFAISTAKNKAMKTNVHYNYEFCKPVVLSYNYIENDDLNILKFDRKDMNWAQFIINNRNGINYVRKTKQKFHNINGYFDVVIGEVADNKITSIAEELLLLNRKLSKDDFDNILYRNKTCQYSFHTEKSVSCVSLSVCDIIKKKEGDVVNE